MDTNRTAASNDTVSPTLDLQQKYERLDRKHQELKNLKQNLLEMIQNKEKEHKEEIETYQQRLEENKKSLREVEDENVSLRFEVADLKQRETHLIEKNKEIKALLRKYYNRVKAMETHFKGGQSYEASISAPSESVMSPSLQPPKFNFERRSSSKRGSQLHPVTECQDNSPTVSLKIPDKLTETYLNTSFDRSKERSHSFLDFRDRNGLGFRENSEPQDQSPGTRYLDLKLNRRDKSVTSIQNFQERSREESEDRWGMPKTSRNALRYSSPDEDSPIKVGRRPSSLRNRRPRSISLSWVEGRDYLNMFNTLSQNIVSLGVKPEISVNKFGIVPAKQEDAPSDDAREKTMKTSMLRYVSKNSTEYLELHYQQTPKNKTFEGFEAYQKKKLFEDFLVIGVDKEDLKSFMKQHPEKKNAKLKPRILFKHPAEGSPDHEAAHNSIPDFAFPFGVSVHKLKSTPSFSSLNPIIYISSEGDQRTKCFMFPLLSGNLTDEAVKMGQVIEGSNPNHLLYNVCIAFRDFVTMSDTDKPRKSLKDVKYWEVNRIMCFMTYYPLTNLFFDLLIKILDILKVERMMALSQSINQNLARHEAVDAQFTHKYLDAIIKKNLDEILAAEAIHFSTKLDFKLQGNFMEVKLSHEIQEQQKAFTMESDWACFTVFEYISLKDLLWLFTALMLERKLVFLSTNLYLLTALLSVLHSLMKPFKYPFPLIFNLPEVLMVLCDAPGAALIGINKGEDFLQSRGLLEEYPSCIYVCIDEEKIYMEKESQPEVPQLESFEKALLGYYHRFNGNLGRNFIDGKKGGTRSSKPKGIKYATTNEDTERCNEVMEVFRSKILDKIIKYIPAEPMFLQNQQLDFEGIGNKILEKAGNSDKAFLKQFVKTQIFAYYLEQVYENNKL